jgi:hypothetical protein
MNLCRLVYLSEATNQPTPAELDALVQNCHVKNESLGISGLLLYSSGNFMQVLEGDELRIDTLYKKIEGDPRHTNVRRLLFKAVDRRLFPDWGMNLGHTERMVAIDQAGVDKVLLRLRLVKDNIERVETQALTLLQEFRRQLMKEAA